MKSVFGTAMTPYGLCGFGYIDDETFFQMMGKNQNPDDISNLKNCKIDPASIPFNTNKTTTITPAKPEVSKEEALNKVKIEMNNNPQFRLFLSTLSKEQQRIVVKQMLDSIMNVL